MRAIEDDASFTRGGRSLQAQSDFSGTSWGHRQAAVSGKEDFKANNDPQGEVWSHADGVEQETSLKVIDCY